MRRLFDLFGKRSEDPRSWYDIGVKLAQDQRFEEAREAFARAIDVSVDATDCVRIGITAEGIEDPYLAIQAYRRATELDPTSLDAFLQAGKLVLKLGHYGDAIKFLRRAVYLSDFDADAALHIAIALERQGNMEEALSHAYIATQRAPENVEGFRVLGRLLSRTNRRAGAVRAWKHATALSPGDTGAMGALGIALAEVGETEEAARVLSEVVRLEPTSAKAQTNLGMVLSQLGALDSALQCLQRALQLNPHSAEMNLNLGVLLLRSGRVDDAVGALYQATELAPDWVAAQYNMGLALRAYGDAKGARNALMRASQLDPDDPEIKQVLEEVLLDQPEHSRARTRARTARERELSESTGSRDSKAAKGKSIAGELESFPLVDILEFLKINHSTGTLQVWTESHRGVVQLYKGDLAGASTPGTRTLTEMLLDTGTITKLDLEIAFGENTNFEDSGNVGAVLVEDGILPKESVMQLVHRQVTDALTELLRWKSGQFSFDTDKETKAVRGTPVAVDTRDVIMTVMTQSDELDAGLIRQELRSERPERDS